jgi:hypothetical protein
LLPPPPPNKLAIPEISGLSPNPAPTTFKTVLAEKPPELLAPAALRGLAGLDIAAAWLAASSWPSCSASLAISSVIPT